MCKSVAFCCRAAGWRRRRSTQFHFQRDARDLYRASLLATPQEGRFKYQLLSKKNKVCPTAKNRSPPPPLFSYLYNWILPRQTAAQPIISAAAAARQSCPVRDFEKRWCQVQNVPAESIDRCKGSLFALRWPHFPYVCVRLRYANFMTADMTFYAVRCFWQPWRPTKLKWARKKRGWKKKKEERKKGVDVWMGSGYKLTV